MKKTYRRWLSLLICLAMLLSVVPLTAWAAEEENSESSTDQIQAATDLQNAADAESSELEDGQAEEPALEDPDAETTIVGRGTCGDNLTWTIDSEGTLTISGIGDMGNYSGTQYLPWADYYNQISNVVIESGVTSIGNSAFMQCSLTGITIPNSVTTINDFAFCNCKQLLEIDIPASVTSISSVAFDGCIALTGIWVAEDNSNYSSDDYGAMYNKEKTTLCSVPGGFQGTYTVLDGVTSIGGSAFITCRSLTNVNLPDGVIRIGSGAFKECNRLTDIKIPGTVMEIASYAFQECSSLEEIVFQGSAPEMADGVFYHVTATVMYPANDATWTEEVRQDDYGGTITWVAVAEDGTIEEGNCGDNLTWKLTADGTLTVSGEEAEVSTYSVRSRSAGTYDMDDYDSAEDTPWYSYQSLIRCVVIEDMVTSIGSNAFNGCRKLEEVSVGTGVTSVGDNAFSNCENVEVTFTGNAPEISDDAFENTSATISYPADNETWDEVTENDFGGSTTWVPEEEQPDPPAPVENPFTDVNETEYYYDAVMWAYSKEITFGTTKTTFAPNGSCTRAQVVTFIWRAMGQPEPTATKNPFEDVTENEYYYKAILWAYENGITFGTTSTTFKPDSTVTRAQAVTFLWRAEKQPSATIDNPFTDVNSGEYYYDAVLWAYENEITLGATETLFQPDASCTRAQVVTFLYRDMGQS